MLSSRLPQDGLAQSAQAAVPTPGDCAPAETVQRLLAWSKSKAGLAPDRMLVLGIMAGAFIGLGAMFFTAVMAETTLGHGPSRAVGGVAFAMGLLLVCMTGAELSTGNCMIATAWADRVIGFDAAVRILWQSYIANALGALGLAALVVATGLLDGAHGAVVAKVTEAKLALSFGQALARGILCNALVCLAVWLILAARTLPAKLFGLLMPISAFIVVGLEHSVANIYLGLPPSKWSEPMLWF